MNPLFKETAADLILEVHPIGELQANATLIYDQKQGSALIFDPGNAPEVIEDLLAERGLEFTDCILTHGHFDHAGSLGYFTEKIPEIFAHEAEQPVIEHIKTQAGMYGMRVWPEFSVKKYFQDGEVLSFFNDKLKLKVLHTPGHSPGSTSFFCENFSNPIVIAGDTLFQLSIGRTDLPGGSYEQIIDSLKNKLMPLPQNTVVVTGHGPTTTIGFEQQNNPFLR